MSEFDAPDTTTPQSIAHWRAGLGIKAARDVIRLTMELFASELSEMKKLDDLSLCHQILSRAVDK